MTMSLGVQLYSVKDHLGPQTGATLQRLAHMGYRHVEPYDILRADGAEILVAALRESGLDAPTAHVHADTADLAHVVSTAQAIGIRDIILPSVDRSRFTDRESVGQLAKDVTELAGRLADSGLGLGYHNHDFEFASTIGGRPAWEVFVDALGEQVFLELDTYWASMGGADVFELLPRYVDRVRFLHVKNAPPDADDPDPKGVDITGRMAEVVQLAGSTTEQAIVELVTDDDLFGLLAANADFFGGVLSR